ncbi:hypothetical protein [Guyparkeria halopsychrophila]|uniref:hypothetical protein n=1 Tax=Guyparkeria halopsychrophila TaxID=3139421 RepID=UPI0037CBDEE8
MKKSLSCLVLAAAVSGCSSPGTTHPDRSLKDDLSACLSQIKSEKDLLLVEAPVANNPLSNAIVNGLAGQSRAADTAVAALNNRDGRPVLVFGENEANNTALLRAALNGVAERLTAGEVCLAATPERGESVRSLAESRGFELSLTRQGG